jgi:hypothetical protein
MRPSEDGESAQMKKLYVRISPNSHPGATRWGSYAFFAINLTKIAKGGALAFFEKTWLRKTWSRWGENFSVPQIFTFRGDWEKCANRR